MMTQHRISLLQIAATVAAFFGVLLLALFLIVRQPSARRWPSSVAVHADPQRLERHVHFLATEARSRNPRHPRIMARAERYIEDRLREAGAKVDVQRYPVGDRTCGNILARFGPREGRLLVVGAHYDVFGDLPGADDNASGTAALLELARILGHERLASPVELVAYSTEEPPYFGGPEMGSAVHARSLREARTPVKGMISLEMLGYFTARQPSPHWLVGLLYPRTGDFVAVVGRWRDRRLAGAVKAGMKGVPGLVVVSYTGPRVLGMDLSDHRNYWAQGFSAVMITDTAYLRNPNYHTAGDLPETLDYVRLARVVDGVSNATLHLAGAIQQ